VIRGEAVLWDAAQQARVARWTFKTALMLDRSSLASRVAPLRHFRYLFTHQSPPESVTGYLARHYPGIGEDHVGVIGSSYRPSNVNPRLYPDPYQITFSIGQAVFQVFGHSGTAPVEIRCVGQLNSGLSSRWVMSSNSSGRSGRKNSHGRRLVGISICAASKPWPVSEVDALNPGTPHRADSRSLRSHNAARVRRPLRRRTARTESSADRRPAALPTLSRRRVAVVAAAAPASTQPCPIRDRRVDGLGPLLAQGVDSCLCLGHRNSRGTRVRHGCLNLLASANQVEHLVRYRTAL